MSVHLVFFYIPRQIECKFYILWLKEYDWTDLGEFR